MGVKVDENVREARRQLADVYEQLAAANSALGRATAAVEQVDANADDVGSPAVQAIIDAIREAGLDPEDLDPAIARQAALRTVAAHAWERELGPLLTSAQARELLGVGSRQGIEQRLKHHDLIGMQERNRRWKIPAFQFADDTPLPDLVDAFWTVRGSVSDWTAAAWCTTPHPELDGHSPRAWAADARDRELLATVARRDAARLSQ